MRIAKNLFIKRPMKWQYILSLVLEIPIFIWFIRNIPQVLWQWGVMMVYIIISFIYYIINRGDMKYYFISVSDQLNKGYIPKFWQCFLSTLLTSTKYIFMGIFFQTMLQSLFGELIIIGIGISTYSFPLLVVMCLILSKILFDISRMPPVYLLNYITIPLFTLSLVGIEKSLLSWTFVSLLLISIIPQFINEDVEKLLPIDVLEVVTGNQNKKNDISKKKFLKLKYQIFIFVPFLYVALIVSEKIIYSNEFNYLFNYIFDKHDSLQSIYYLSQTNLIVTGIKVYIILFLLIPYFEYSNYIINSVSMFLIKVIEKNDNNIEYGGVYVRVKYKKKKWIIDNLDYYFCYKRWFYNHKEGNLYLSRKDILTSKMNKKIKPITDKIFRIDGDYYIDYNSSILRRLLNSNKVYGYKLLNRPDHFVMFFPLTIIILTLSCSRYVNTHIQKNFRGDYVLAYVKSGKIESVNESKKIQFKNNEISHNKRIYAVDNITMQILDNNSEVVGEYTKQGILVFKDDSKNVSYYILKSSQLYENTTNK